MFKLDLENAEEPEIKLPTSVGLYRKQENSRNNIYFCFIDYAKVFDCVDQTTWPASCEMCMQVKGQHLEPDMEQQTGSKLGKESIRAVYCHPAYLTYMQNTLWETLGWKKHKLESRLPGEISITLDIQMTIPLWKKVKRN